MFAHPQLDLGLELASCTTLYHRFVYNVAEIRLYHIQRHMSHEQAGVQSQRHQVQHKKYHLL